MSSHSNGPTTYGFGGSLNWLLGSAVGGVAGSILFGAVLWIVDPAIVTETIPAIYGIDPGTIGLVFHLLHGAVLGIIFGFIVSRNPIFSTITADATTGLFAGRGLTTRFALAGLVYGLAVWAFLPLIVQSIWITFTGIVDPGFPFAAFEILIGHLLYGLLLGALFAVFVETAPEAEETESPFDETSDAD